jgi:aryl-alcohol dehydrogenase-like predicted oxidoreductase
MLTRSLGVNGPTSSAIGLGCMGMSDFYGPSDRAESIATIRMALDANVTLLDTGDFYGMGHNEMLIAEAIQGRPRDQIILSVKFGAQRDPGGKWVGFDARPAAVKTALAYTLKRLGTDHIDIYRPARLDPNVSVEDTVGAIAEMVKAGYVRHIGLSEVGSETTSKQDELSRQELLIVKQIQGKRSTKKLSFNAHRLKLALFEWRRSIHALKMACANSRRNRHPRLLSAQRRYQVPS